MSRSFLVPINLNKLELLNAVMQNLSSAPSSPVEGQMYYDTVNHSFLVYNGTAWDRLDESYLLARANHTGTQTASTISDFDTQVRTSRLDQMAAPTADVSLNSHKLTNVTDPTAASDAATKGYVDSVGSGLTFKAPARVATTANITLSGTQTIDGVSVSAGDRVLVKNQTTGSANGIYVVAAGAWSRATDADTSAEVKGGTALFVDEGTTQADTQWVLTTNDPITLGTTSLTFVQFGAGTSYSAGTGLTLAGTVFSRDSAYVDTIAQGGTGQTTAAAALAALGGVAKYSQDVGDGSSTAIVVTHNLGTRDVTVQVHEAGSPYAVVVPDIEITSTNTITLRFAVAPTTAQYRVVIHG